MSKSVFVNFSIVRVSIFSSDSNFESNWTKIEFSKQVYHVRFNSSKHFSGSQKDPRVPSIEIGRARKITSQHLTRNRRSVFRLGKYSKGYNKLIYGDFKPGTNSLDAFGACVECGACSEEKFLESDELNGLKTGQIIYYVVFGSLPFVLVCCCGLCCLCGLCCGTDDTAQDDSPPPVQPVMQPTTNVAINNNAGFQPPQQQVNNQIEFK